MGHQPGSDLKAVIAATETVWELVQQRVFPGEAEFLLELPELTIESSSFRLEFRLQQDRLGWDSDAERTMIPMRFGPARERLPDSPWTLYVRGDWPERTDRFPRRGPLRVARLRKAFSPKRRPPDDPHSDVMRNDDLYVMERAPKEDTTAQICLFLLQTGLSDDAALFQWLSAYLTDDFRLSASGRTELADAIVTHMLEHKWWAENSRSWRMYVARVARGLRKAGLTTSDTETRSTRTTPQTVEDDQIARIDSKRSAPDDSDHGLHLDETGRAWGMLRASIRPYDPTRAVYTVDEAVARTGLARSTIYSRIGRGRIAAAVDARGRMIISAAEVERLKITPRRNAVVALVAEARCCSRETARKYVYRLERRGRVLCDIQREPSLN
jgi:hypothetical protein